MKRLLYFHVAINGFSDSLQWVYKAQQYRHFQPPCNFNIKIDKCIDRLINCERCYQVQHWVPFLTVAGCKQSAFEYRARTWSIADITQIAPYSYISCRRLSDIAQEQQNDNTRFYMIMTVTDKQFNFRLDLSYYSITVVFHYQTMVKK